MGLPLLEKIALRDARKALVFVDMSLNWMTGGRWGETISFRAAKARAGGSRGACVLCRFLDLFQKDHCAITLRNHDTQRTVGS